MSPGARLRDLLVNRRPLVAPGASIPLFARLVEEAGFEAVYLSGAGVANLLLGRPDIGLTTLSEMAQAAARLTEATSLPVVADADTGYGGVHNVARTVRAYEAAGVAGLHIEDQEFPKVCGHFDGKRVVGVELMLQRIEAALRARQDAATVIIARTDAAEPLGIEEAIRRARLYGEAGADVLFVEAMRTEDELERVGRELGRWPLVANMVEFGKTPLLPAARLAELGFALVLYPGAIVRTITRAARELLAQLKADGSTSGALASMASLSELNAMLGLDVLHKAEEEIERAAAMATRQ